MQYRLRIYHLSTRKNRVPKLNPASIFSFRTAAKEFRFNGTIQVGCPVVPWVIRLPQRSVPMTCYGSSFSDTSYPNRQQ
ncbi:hypothetical protein ACFSQD_08610 [Flavihumibacter stibioxidans]|uniref:Uncharacterized protein n=1 Tax=Flavihumibacter stibioxidans TaxID=1834163 RepID=A0ABR7M5S4_9BACT|nr:hypothetical protein [Flavihumibacter stibioxidans]MBC6490369.1 hypothetical protein [Flavihumibacter stibioxidans]